MNGIKEINMIKKTGDVFYKWASEDNNRILAWSAFWLLAGFAFDIKGFLVLAFVGIWTHMLGEVLITAARNVKPIHAISYSEAESNSVSDDDVTL